MLFREATDNSAGGARAKAAASAAREALEAAGFDLDRLQAQVD